MIDAPNQDAGDEPAVIENSEVHPVVHSWSFFFEVSGAHQLTISPSA